MSTSKKIETAIKAFETATGIKAYYEKPEKESEYVIVLETEQGKQKYLAEQIPALTKQSIGAIANHLHSLSPTCVLITKYVNPILAEELKSREVFFIDTCGNAYFKHTGIYLYLKGNKPEHISRYPQSAHGFSMASLKLIFLFLCIPESLNTPYRQMADKANVALGTVGKTIESLKEKHYLLDKGQYGRKMMNTEKLIQYWAAAYADRLRPKLLIATYQSPIPNWWRNTQSLPPDIHFGGEVAAEHLTHYLKPEKITLYTKGNINNYILKNQLKKDPHGNIEMLTKFWNFDLNAGPYAPDLLTYADLLSSGDPRNSEVAGLIFENSLSRYFKFV